MRATPMIIRRTAEFKRNFKKLKRKHYDMDKLAHVINLIVDQQSLTLITRHKEH